MLDDIFGMEELLPPVISKTVPKEKKINIKFDHTVLPDCLSNLIYPTCSQPYHEFQPMSMVCIDKECNNKSLICALCENEKHYKHLCVPLKYYLNEVYGHLSEQKQEGPMVMRSQPEVLPVPKQKSKKNKGKNKQTQIQVKSSPTTTTNQAPQNVLYYTSKIQNQKTQFLKLITEYRQSLIEKFHILETTSIKYFNKKIQQASRLISIQNPIERIEKMFHKVQRFKNAKQQAKNGEEANNFNSLLNQETKKLQKFVQGILRTTRIDSKFDLPEKLMQITRKSINIFAQLGESLHKVHSKYEEQLVNFEKNLDKQLNCSQEGQDFSKIYFKFSEQFKGHKFIVKNQGKLAEQTGMESSGQRFLLLQPSLPKNLYFGNKVCTWGIKIIKLAGWIALGISLKNKIVNGKYTFNYGSIGHGSYLISANGYSWSHSLMDFNSAFKSFSFTIGDIVYLQYSPVEKKIKFFKNANTNSFELDVTDPPENDEYCPSINMCSTGDSVELVDEKPSFL